MQLEQSTQVVPEEWPKEVSCCWSWKRVWGGSFLVSLCRRGFRWGVGLGLGFEMGLGEEGEGGGEGEEEMHSEESVVEEEEEVNFGENRDQKEIEFAVEIDSAKRIRASTNVAFRLMKTAM